ncbi:MAG: aspartate aminotransferase [Myxococcota bacterium]
MEQAQSLIRIPSDIGTEEAKRGFSHMASSMSGSSILSIGQEIREMLDRNEEVANLTVGDFSPKQFPIPDLLRQYLIDAINDGHTNYPPSAGIPDLRAAVKESFMRNHNLDYPIDGIAIVSGGRPSLYSAYKLLVDPGELVLFPVPSWNNHNYGDTCQIRVRGIQTLRKDSFQPTVDLLKPHVRDARMIVLNSPQNPSGGVMPEKDLREFGEFIVEENERRQAAGEKPLYLLFDQIYSLLVFDDHKHFSPVQLVPECAPYVIHCDGISKSFAATGLRCGWFVGPPAITRKLVALGTHIGTWAPLPVQVATAKWLRNLPAISEWQSDMIGRVRERLDCLHDGIQKLREHGFACDSIEPQGAIYISVQFLLYGKKTPSGMVLKNNEDVRSYLLQSAGFGVVPFAAFGVEQDDENGWFRASVGAVSVADLEQCLPRLEAALTALS